MFTDVSPETAFDVIMDPEYRPSWDEASIRDFDICKLDGFNDIGYYACKFQVRLGVYNGMYLLIYTIYYINT